MSFYGYSNSEAFRLLSSSESAVFSVTWKDLLVILYKKVVQNLSQKELGTLARSTSIAEKIPAGFMNENNLKEQWLIRDSYLTLSARLPQRPGLFGGN